MYNVSHAMRLFTGIAIDPGVLESMMPLLARLKASAALNWSRPENLHITTKFIGQWPEAKLDPLKKALQSVRTEGPFTVKLSGFGFFPNASRPRVFYGGVQGGEQLPALARHIEEACETVGCPREDRDYSPHLTLAKIRNAKIAGLRQYLEQYLEEMNTPEFGRFEASEFHLYLSTPSGAGSIYSKLASFPLT